MLLAPVLSDTDAILAPHSRRRGLSSSGSMSRSSPFVTFTSPVFRGTTVALRKARSPDELLDMTEERFADEIVDDLERLEKAVTRGCRGAKCHPYLDGVDALSWFGQR